MEKICFEHTTQTRIREFKYTVEWSLNDLSLKREYKILDVDGEKERREYDIKAGLLDFSLAKYFKEYDEIIEVSNNDVAEYHLYVVLYNMLDKRWPIISKINTFAEQGDTIAQTIYGYFKKDIPMLEQAANKGDGLACDKLADFYLGYDDVKKDLKKSIYYLEKGAEFNSIICLSSLREKYNFEATKNKVNPEDDYDKATHYSKIIDKITGCEQNKIAKYTELADVLRTIKKFDSFAADKKISTVFDDGKSAKYWNVMWDDNRYIVSFGKLGKPGSYDFWNVKDPEKDARKKADAKIKKGYIVQ